MQKFVYPNDYLKVRGNVIHCWEIHKKKMKKIGKVYVDYSTFWMRLNKGWDLNTAINTPMQMRNRSRIRKLYLKLRTLYFRFIYLFKRGQ